MRLSVLGPPVVERDGAVVAFDTRKAIALLAYLAVTGRPCRRETLAGVGWPDAAPDRANASLRRTLSTIRRVAGADVLTADGGTIGLDRSAIWVDVDAARDAVAVASAHPHGAGVACTACVPPLTAAAVLHRGPFLEGFGLRDSPEFDEWALRTADALQRELADLLALLVDAHVLNGDLSAAAQLAQRHLALDALHEPAHRTLMRLYTWQGRRGAALRQYRECVRVLEQELGVPPVDETTRLYDDIVADRLPPSTRSAAPGHAAAAPVPTPVQQPAGSSRAAPFVGRDDELATLAEAIEQPGALIVVEGEAGIGKTRLLDQVCGTVGEPQPVRITCRQDESTLAFGAVVEALRRPGVRPRLRALAEHTRRELARVLPELADRANPPPPADGPGATWRLHDALSEALVAAVNQQGGARPGVLIVDDAHWLDESSLDVIAHLGRRLRDRPVSMVLAWRIELVRADHRLRRLLTDATRQAAACAIVLDRLDEVAVRTLVADRAGDGAPDLDALTDRMMATTEGVPLLVVEYMAALERDARAFEGPTPPGARDLFAARLGSVSDVARQVLTTAAAIGGPFDPDLVRRASGRTEQETTDALEELASAKLIGEHDDGPLAYDFAHSRMRAITYESAGPARRRLLHRRIAAALERRDSTVNAERSLALAVMIAGHHRAAGDDARAADWSHRAARGARDLLAVPDAVAQYEAALMLGHPDTADIHAALGELHTLTGRYDEALRHLEAAVALAGDEQFADLEHQIAAVHVRWGKWVLADQHLGIALDALDDGGGAADGALRARLLTDRGLVAHHLGQHGSAKALATDALAAAEASGDLGALAEAHNLLGVVHKRDLSVARLHLEHALALARRTHDVATEVAAANNLAQAHAWAGAVDLALPLAESALQRAARLGDRHRQAALHNNLADLLHTLGRHDDARTHLTRAVELFADIGRSDVPEPEVWKLAEW
ncbi:MAG TPA: AAA family ATPase [Euzebyales bacterium]